METKTHWKNFTDPSYLGTFCFSPNEEKVLTIKEVKQETLKAFGPGGVKSDIMPVLHFVEDALPFGLNATNCKMLTKLYGPYIEDWVGRKIQVYVTKTKFAGESVDCLRIRNFEPNNAVEYHCAVCGAIMAKDLYDKSIAKYGKAYCSKECYELQTKGEDLLK